MLFRRWQQGNTELARVRSLESAGNVTGLIAELRSETAHGRYSIIRSHAADALGRLGDNRAVPHLIELAADDTEADARHAAIRALAALKAKDAQAVMLDALNDPTPLVRAAAAKGLGTLRASEAIPDLTRVLDADAHAEVRLAAVDALVELGDKDVLPRLHQALQDVSWRVRSHPRRKELKRIADAYEASLK